MRNGSAQPSAQRMEGGLKGQGNQRGGGRIDAPSGPSPGPGAFEGLSFRGETLCLVDLVVIVPFSASFLLLGVWFQTAGPGWIGNDSVRLASNM